MSCGHPLPRNVLFPTYHISWCIFELILNGNKKIKNNHITNIPFAIFQKIYIAFIKVT